MSSRMGAQRENREATVGSLPKSRHPLPGEGTVSGIIGSYLYRRADIKLLFA